jgi:hypothetical protein
MNDTTKETLALYNYTYTSLQNCYYKYNNDKQTSIIITGSKGNLKVNVEYLKEGKKIIDFTYHFTEQDIQQMLFLIGNFVSTLDKITLI